MSKAVVSRRAPRDLWCEAGIVRCGKPARLYPCGTRCDEHAPWAVAGRTIPVPPVRAPRLAAVPTPAPASGEPPRQVRVSGPARMVSARYWCPVCRRFSARFLVRVDRESVEVAAKLAVHRATHPEQPGVAA